MALRWSIVLCALKYYLLNFALFMGVAISFAMFMFSVSCGFCVHSWVFCIVSMGVLGATAKISVSRFADQILNSAYCALSLPCTRYDQPFFSMISGTTCTRIINFMLCGGLDFMITIERNVFLHRFNNESMLMIGNI
jgi:hypothetical protein